MDTDERNYADYLNELYGTVEVCGYEYEAGDVLYELDPTAFAVGMSDWEVDNEIARAEYEADPNGGDGDDD